MDQGLLTIELLLQGVGMLISWNAILTSMDWLVSLYPSYTVGTWISVCFFVPALIVQPLNAVYGRAYSYTKRINGGYLAMCVALLLLPLSAAFVPAPIGFLVVCGLVCVIGASSALTQSTIFSLAATLPTKATSLIMKGNSVAGLLITGFRLVCLGLFDGDPLASTLVYFAIAALSLVVCMLAQVDLMKHPVLKKVGFCFEAESPLLSPTGLDIDELRESSWGEVASLVWEYVALVWLCFFVTFAMLTNVAIATESSWMPYTYFTTLMFLTFNLFDFLGRVACGYFAVQKKAQWIIALGRFVFWASFITIATYNWAGTWTKFLNMAGFAFTNGYSSTCTMSQAPSAVHASLKDRAGILMSVGLLLGIISGTLAGFCFQSVGQIPLS